MVHHCVCLELVYIHVERIACSLVISLWLDFCQNSHKIVKYLLRYVNMLDVPRVLHVMHCNTVELFDQ